MKKNKKIISLTAAAALLCVGGAFALNANTTVSADTNPVATESQQIMLGASVLLDGVVDTGDDTGIIRFPVIVRDEVKKQIVESKIYVLPQASWEKETPPTPQEIMGHAEKFEGITKNQEGSIDKWVDYYEDIKPYDSDYEQAVVYMKNIPMEQFASAFHVCSWMKLSDGTTVTEDFSEVVSRSMEYVAAAAVNSGEYTTEQLGKYLTTEVNYTVTPYLRTIYGTYKAADAKNVTGKKGVNVTAQDLEQDGYTINKALTAQANAADLIVDGGETFNVYYENDAYKFETQKLDAIKNATIVDVDESMTGLAATDLQPNMYTITSPHNAEYHHTFKYTEDNVGKYLVFNVYYTKLSYAKAQVWNAPATAGVATWHYDGAGNLGPGGDASYYLNKWTNVVVYLDETNFPKNKNSFYMSLSNYGGDITAYFGEYTFLTAEQFSSNFEAFNVVDTTKVPEGVTYYRGDTMVMAANAGQGGGNCIGTYSKANGRSVYTSTAQHYSICGVRPSATTSWAAGYVAVKVYSYTKTGNLIQMFKHDQKTLNAELVYDEDGNVINYDQAQANKWYTYIFNLPEDVAATSMYVGSILVYTVNESGLKFAFDSVYTFATDKLDAFLGYKFPNGTVYDKFAESHKSCPTKG